MSCTHIVFRIMKMAKRLKETASLESRQTLVAECRITEVVTILNNLVVELSTKSSRFCKAMEIDKCASLIN